MTTFLLSLLPVSLGIWCIHILFQEGHLLEKLGDHLRGPESEDEDQLTRREYWMKPLFDCPICMSSVWGFIGFFSLDFLFGIHHDIKLLIPFIFCLCGLNTIILKMTSHDRVLKEIDKEAFRQLWDLKDHKKAA